MVNGFDTSSTQRAYGNNSGTGFGNLKALDIWTYIPIGPVEEILYVIDPTDLDMRVTKSHSGLFAFGDNGGNFTITVTNVGAFDITTQGTSLTDTLPPNTTLADTPTGTGWTCEGGAGETSFTCTRDADSLPLVTGASYPPISYLINIAPGATNPLINVSEIETEGDTNPDNDRTEDSAFLSAADITVSKRNIPTVFGDSFDWVMRTRNEGGTPAVFADGEVILLDQLPEGATYSLLTVANFVNILNEENIQCELNASNQIICIASGGTVTFLSNSSFNVRIRVIPTTETYLVNAVSVDPDNVITESNEDNNSDTDTVIFPHAAMDVLKATTTDVITEVGQEVYYLFRVTNTGTVPLTGITMTDPLCDSNPELILGDANSNNILDVDENWFYSCTHTVTEEEVGGPVLANLVTVDSNETDPEDDNVNVPIILPTVTPTFTPTFTPSPTPTRLPTFTPTPTRAPSFTPTTLPSGLPDTGFAPGQVTVLDPRPDTLVYNSYSELWIEIPRLKEKMDIIGVPQVDGGWDVSWLGNDVGWLNGTAFPTYAGNSVLTGHVVDANGLPGPFGSLNKLRFGDQVIIRAWGQRYIFEVRETDTIRPNDTKTALKHETLSWITLLTCKTYDEGSGTYLNRYIVRAVLVKIE